MTVRPSYVGSPTRRVDGRLKVTGAAQYAAEFPATDLLYGCVVPSAISRGAITAIDTAEALAIPGVVQVFTHENRRATAWLDYNYRDDVAPPGSPHRPLYDKQVHFAGQAVALVVAEDFDTARYAASLVQVQYEEEPTRSDLAAEQAEAYEPPKKRSGVEPPPKPRGDAEKGFNEAQYRVEAGYHVPAEHHNPMELFASTVVWEGDGKLTVHDKTQGAQNSQRYVAKVFNLGADDVRVVSPYVGGAFGSALRPQYQLFLAVMAALELERSVRVTLSRDQCFALGYRPEAIQHVALGADIEGNLVSIRHEVVSGTSQFEDYQENIVNWSGLIYTCDNVQLGYKLAKLDTNTPCDMRAPGATTGVYALEVAMDELAYASGMDPIDLRLRNYTHKDQITGKPYTSKELEQCYRQGAERFGWSRRKPAPRSMREGRELVGYGMATGCWEAFMMKTSARAVLTADGRLEVASATADIGTGTYTILAQIGADELGLPLEHVTSLVGDSSLPTAPVEGGSWAAASTGSAVQLACATLREKLFKAARSLDNSPLANATLEHVRFAGGRITVDSDPARSVSLAEVMRGAKLDRIEAEETASPSRLTQMNYSAYTHSAIFVEARVDEELGVVRIPRIVSAVAAGKILNPKTARSQILGGVVMGMGMALHEESILDHGRGRFMNHNLAEYHVPAHADVDSIEVIFVEEDDDKASPIGVKGLGEIGIVGTAAAIGNAIFHATGRRVRDLPITLDKLLG